MSKEIQRNKGLGEMSPEAFKHTLNREEFTKISVDDMASAKQTLDICFGKDTNLRKELLLDVESTGAVASSEEEKYGPKSSKTKASAKPVKTTAKAKVTKATAKATPKATKKKK
ncbi:MAG: hypothetical protein K2Q18_02155 [Bdellovibrionales bacterium]|nr:hypothetical protein [Bdellovibrionales bacterium]